MCTYTNLSFSPSKDRQAAIGSSVLETVLFISNDLTNTLPFPSTDTRYFREDISSVEMVAITSEVSKSSTVFKSTDITLDVWTPEKRIILSFCEK